ISPAGNITFKSTGTKANWFGWPTDERMEELRAAWFDAPDLAAQKKLCEEMQIEFWKNPPYAPLGMYDQPTAFRNYLTDVHDGWPRSKGRTRKERGGGMGAPGEDASPGPADHYRVGAPNNGARRPQGGFEFPATSRSCGARPGVDHRRCHAQPRTHGVRHAV